MLAELVVPLNCDGYSLNGLVTSDPPGRPIVTVKPGERILFRGEPRRVLAVEVLRLANRVPGGNYAKETLPTPNRSDRSAGFLGDHERRKM